MSLYFFPFLYANQSYLFSGEVNVAQEDLNSFLAVAEELQIKGLTNRENNSNDSNNQSSSKKTKRPAAPDTQTPVKKVRKSSPAPITSSGDDHKDVVNIKDDPEVMASASTSHQAVNPEVDADFGEEFDESYDGYYDEQGEEVGETGEATDGTKGRHTFFSHTSKLYVTSHGQLLEI